MRLKKEYISKDLKSRLYKVAVPIVGLTGGMATGKSTASAYLKNKYNFTIIDADQLIKKIYSFDSTIELVKSIAPAAFGEKIDFRVLREIYLKDKSVEEKLQSHLFSLLPEEFKKSVVGEVVIYDAPLIFEKNLQELLDQTLLITCSEATQVNRIIARDSVTEDQARAMLKLQLPLGEKEEMANQAVRNDGSVGEFRLKIDDWVKNFFE